MPELIDRQAVLAEIGEFQIRFNETGDSHERVAYASAEHCMLVIKAAPTIEAEPVRHGRWIEHGGGIVATCSNCYATYHKDVLQSITPYAEHLTRHCPHCGARMDAPLPEPEKE